MDKKEAFKIFASNHPELVKTVQNKKSTWQELYEIFDIYGDNLDAWKPYLEEKESISLNNIVKNIDLDSIQSHINTAQKALGFISELTKTNVKDVVSNTPLNPRPITKFFGD